MLKEPQNLSVLVNLILCMSARPLGDIDHWSRACWTRSVKIRVLGGEKHLADTQKLSQSHPCGSQDTTALQTSFLSSRRIMRTFSLSV